MLTRLLMILVLVLGVWWTVDAEVSRRMANAGYVIWIVATNLGLLVSFLVIDVVFYGGGASRLLESVNRHQLVAFMIGNLLTGAVNLSIDTLNTSPAVAFVVLNVYAIVLVVVAVRL